MPRRRGRRYVDAMTLWRFSPLLFKNHLYRWTANTEPGPGYIHLPNNVSDAFVRQFTSQELRTVRRSGKTRGIRPNARAGHIAVVWLSGCDGQLGSCGLASAPGVSSQE